MNLKYLETLGVMYTLLGGTRAFVSPKIPLISNRQVIDITKTLKNSNMKSVLNLKNKFINKLSEPNSYQPNIINRNILGDDKKIIEALSFLQ